MDEWLDFSELIDKVQEYLELGLFDEAKVMLDQVAEAFRDEWELYFLYSRIYAEQNKPKEALPCLHRGLQIERTNVDCLLGLFYAHAMMSQVKRGGKYLLRAEKYHSNNELVLTALIWYYTEMNCFDKAIFYFTKAQKNGTMNPEAFRNVALAYERSGDYESSEQCFKTALDLNPQFDEVRDLLADHYLFLGEAQKAISLYQDALKDSPKNIRIMSRLVFCLSQNGQIDQASSIAKDSIRLYPNSPIGYVDLSYVYLNSNDFENAVATVNKALDISPIDAEAFRVKGIAYSELDKLEDAKIAFETAMSLDPENPEIMRDYYHHLRDSQEHEQMEELVHKVITLESPYCMEDYWFLADYYREQGEDVKAFHYLNKAYKSMPGEKELIPPMVDILLDQGHTTYSIPFMAKYVEKSGWNEVMTQFSLHKRLRGKWNQEGLRLLRFWGEKVVDYRKYIFTYYLKKFLIIFIALLFFAFLFPSYMLFGIPGAASVIFLYAAIIGSYHLTKYFIRRNGKGLKNLTEVLP